MNLSANGLIKDFADGGQEPDLNAEDMVVLSDAAGERHHQPGVPDAAGGVVPGQHRPAQIDLSTPMVLDKNYKLVSLNLGLHFSDDQLVRNLVFTGSANGTIKVRWRQMSAKGGATKHM
jgi:hypothetical protein